ncbi:MAG: hypothetical protein WCB64_07165 [Desulfobaccales bacterium]
MGTSSARRGPTGPLWRLAKRAASRYFSPGNAGPLAAREVAARYVAALGEGSAPPEATGALAAFRLTRRVAQNLGAFYCEAAARGWPAALAAWGLREAAGEEGTEVPAQSLSAALEIPGGGLEQAVAHTALVGLLLRQPRGGRGGGVWAPVPIAAPVLAPEAARLVQRFLGDAFSLRLLLDLGESLEAAAPGFSPLRQGANEISRWIEQAAADPSSAPPPLNSPEDWLGLPGWTWVTGVFQGLLRCLRDQGCPQNFSEKI